MVEITKIKLKNLLDFVNSEEYNSFTNKPISLSRVQSYINNPNSNKNDIVLYMAFIKGVLVGYRTILSDVFYDNNKKISFGWLSGNWVDPKYRRKNISTSLFSEVLSDWNKKLMFSNYAEASKSLYDKTNLFKELKTLKGVRYYRRFCLSNILPPKHPFFNKIKWLFKISDFFLNALFDLRFINRNNNLNKDINKLTHWNEEVQQFLLNFKKDELFKRDFKTYQWINNFPWVKTDLINKKKHKQYHFSSYANIFINDFYIIKNNNKIVSIINISIKNNQLKIPYFYSLPEGVIPSKTIILNLNKKYKINFLTIYDERINELFSKVSFLKQKSFIQKYFITTNLINDYKNLKNKEIQTGDGDNVFT